MTKKLSGCSHLEEWAKWYPQLAARLDARLEGDCLVFDVGTWEEANAILYATTPKSPPVNGE